MGLYRYARTLALFLFPTLLMGCGEEDEAIEEPTIDCWQAAERWESLCDPHGVVVLVEDTAQDCQRMDQNFQSCWLLCTENAESCWDDCFNECSST
jgi:hypothetical protein